jgi:dipeptidyl aminopeptidase/acylaminoacyl peptidase
MSGTSLGSLPFATTYLETGGRQIRVETFPDKSNATVSVIVLHGANGLRYANPAIYGAVQYLAVNGLAAHVVHYFDRTGTVYADDQTIHASFGDWCEVVADAILWVRRTFPERRLAIFGHSLGGYLASAHAIRNEHIEAAVILSGGLDENSARAIARTPPALILHGSSDTRVPLTEARRLEAVMTAAGRRPVVHVYSGEGHLLQMASYVDALRRATEFIVEHLGENRARAERGA